jgi:thioredoxin 1
MTVELNEQTFNSEIVAAKANGLVDFYAPWCGPCRMMAPIVDNLAKKFPNAKVVKINIDDYQDLAVKYNVSVIPTFVYFKNGEPVFTQQGVVTEAELAKNLEEKVLG